MTTFDRASGRLVFFVVCAFTLMVVRAIPAVAEDGSPAKAATAVQDAAKKGFPLNSSSTDVTGNISVEATLIPAKIAKTVFGKEVSNNYAIIALTISNRSSDESFIVHSVFVDYSQWLLSGSSEQSSYTLCPESKAGSSEAKTQNKDTANPPSGDSGKAAQPCSGNLLRPWQQQTWPNHISTVETRIVRGELLDRQPWTTRNWVLRALQAVGSIAAGFTFATTNEDWIRGIGAYNAHFIPATQTFWPDATVGQMNRISDFGFQVNKVIAKQSSDIIVTFFPIDRFLTRGFREIFLHWPSVFFSPYAMLLDQKRPTLIDQILEPIFGATEPAAAEAKADFIQHLPEIANGECKGYQSKPNQPASATAVQPQTTDSTCPAAGTFPPYCKFVRLLDGVSLNTVRVLVGGTMTVDVNKVPPQITEVDIDVPAGKDATTMWTLTDAKPTTLTGVIRGSFLGGGTPTVTNLGSKAQVKGVTEGSSDTELHFTITLNEDLPAGTKLSFQVSKKSDNSTFTSAAHDYTIPTAPPAGKNTGAPGGSTGGASGPTSEAKPQLATPAGTSTAPATPPPAPPNPPKK